MGVVNFCSFFLFVQLVFQSGTFVNGARRQTLAFYTEPNCRGQSETFYENEPDIQQNSIIGKHAKSVAAQTGTWVVAGVLNGDAIFDGWMTGNIGMLCTTWHVGNQSAIYTSIRRVAGSDLDKSSISLYSGPNFKGTEIHIDDTMDFTLRNITMNAKSIALTGTRHWGAFSRNDFAGLPACILAQDMFGFPFDVSMYTLLDINVGSARIGCRIGLSKNLPKSALTDITVEKRLNNIQKQSVNNNDNTEFITKIGTHIVSKMQVNLSHPDNSIQFKAESFS